MSILLEETGRVLWGFSRATVEYSLNYFKLCFLFGKNNTLCTAVSHTVSLPQTFKKLLLYVLHILYFKKNEKYFI